MASMSVGSSAGPLDIPPTQNTAPVHEYRCMFTSDLRRKQKRWQDGRLKYHTFNKRVMVYDERSNLVGDAHWKKGYDLEAGVELELDRGGVLVQVDDCLRKEDQDLHELLSKRVKEKEERASARSAISPLRQASIRPQGFVTPSAVSQQKAQGPATPNGMNALRPKLLNAVIGNPTGHYGRALAPTTSPFEQGLANGQNQPRQERPAKRQRRMESLLCKTGYAQSLMGATLTLSSHPPSSAGRIRYESLMISRVVLPSTSNTIDLTLDDENGSTGSRAKNRTRRDEECSDDCSNTHKMKPYGSPPRSSGYASKLTGATLSLGAARQPTLTRHHESSGLRFKRVNQSRSISEEHDPFNSHSLKQRIIASTERKATSKKNDDIRKPTPAVITPSSPPTSPTKVTRNEISEQRATPILDQPADGISLNRPLTSLRIKARPPRKMMMLMQRSSSGPLQRTEPFESLKAPSSQPRRQYPPPSQSTQRSDDFLQKQVDLLAARLKGKDSTVVVDDEEPFSLPPNSGINAETLDLLLTRKQRSNLIQEGACTATNSRSRIQQDNSTELELSMGRNKEGDANRGSPHSDSNSLEITPDEARGTRELLANAIKRSSSGISTSANSSFGDAGLELAGDGGSSHGGSSNYLQSGSNGNFSATDRFRKIIKVSGSALSHGFRPSLALMNNGEDLRNLQPPAPVVQDLNRPEFEFTIKSSSKPSPLRQPLSSGNHVTTRAELSGFRSASHVTDNSEPPNLQPATIPRPQITNPATGGRSLQMIAVQTVDAIAPASNATPPPRIPTGLLPEVPGNRKARDRSGKAPIGGPWSREAFDLFGSWRPPQTKEGVAA